MVPSKLVINADNAGKSDALMGEGPLEPSAALLEAVEAEGTANRNANSNPNLNRNREAPRSTSWDTKARRWHMLR